MPVLFRTHFRYHALNRFTDENEFGMKLPYHSVIIKEDEYTCSSPSGGACMITAPYSALDSAPVYQVPSKRQFYLKCHLKK